ncbi:hypothetical protein QRB36_04090 [Mycobacterium marseillense]|uniref:Uncharacterized protein n=1 Tax=Mycobacterium [tuberculosis] TKK-01-0051 TaxID=1324261 RepID=A0A051TWA6_9MYCO|nr:hypothetical protein K875_04175 [Mycobacterium [tuberculosis] TKK-01-0051]MDM3973343.1 hypothetical protein [Mycobacterium marseillense]
MAQYALVTTVIGIGGFSDKAEVDADDPAGESVGRNISANVAGIGSSLEASHQRVSEFGSPQLRAFGGVIGSADSLVVVD